MRFRLADPFEQVYKSNHVHKVVEFIVQIELEPMFKHLKRLNHTQNGHRYHHGRHYDRKGFESE